MKFENNNQLLEIINIFNNYPDIGYCFDSGTLLGIVRDKMLIDGDKDIEHLSKLIDMLN
jgi:phosphorylcholine metabolism protein LicD